MSERPHTVFKCWESLDALKFKIAELEAKLLAEENKTMDWNVCFEVLEKRLAVAVKALEDLEKCICSCHGIASKALAEIKK